MPIPITMPRLSDTMEAGTIIKWNIKEGDKVSSGDVIADIETDKATMEMTAYDDGTVAKIAVPEGQSTPIGSVIAVLAAEGEDPKEAAKAAGGGGGAGAVASAKQSAPQPQQKAAAKPQGKQAQAPAVGSTMTEEDSGQPKPAVAAVSKSQVAPKVAAAAQQHAESDSAQQKTAPTKEQASPPAGNGRIFVSPMARRLSEEHHLDLRSIEGSGPGGRIIKRDVLAAMDAAKETTAAVPPSARTSAQPQQASGEMSLATRVPSGPAPTHALGFGGISPMQSQIVPLSNMRQIIAKRLVESKTTIPHYQVTLSFNMDPLLELRRTLNEQLEAQGVKLSVNDFIVRCCALAMHQHPEFNSSWGGDHIEINGDVNIGIAISLPSERGGGLVVATIRNADQKGLRQISYESKTLAEKARTRGLTIQEMSDSTFTISNLGMFGVDNFTAIINPPNSGILAVGAALERPVVRNHELTVGHEMAATLSLDHRVIDGAMAARYLQTLKQLIENPGTLLV